MTTSGIETPASVYEIFITIIKHVISNLVEIYHIPTVTVAPFTVLKQPGSELEHTPIDES
jgi:hypothetical protein